jgi:peptide/nickel transport system permease protein
MFGLVLVAAHLIAALVSPFVVPYPPDAMNASVIMQPPSTAHWLGTDELGRDVFSRTLMGGRIALVVTLSSIVLALAWGGLVGILVGLLGGIVDHIVMRVIDAVLAIPEMLFLLCVASIAGNEMPILILALGFFYGVEVTRIARTATLNVVAQDYILAARTRGERRSVIVFRELLPNVVDILLVEGSMRWSWMLLSFGALSFLGFGATPPTPDWGLMIAQGYDTLGSAPWITLAPIVAMSSLIVSVNLLVGALAKAIGIDRVDGMAV